MSSPVLLATSALLVLFSTLPGATTHQEHLAIPFAVPSCTFLPELDPGSDWGCSGRASWWVPVAGRPVTAAVKLDTVVSQKEASGSHEMEACWRTTFLAVSILISSCFLQAQTQDSHISITLIPPEAIQGQNITLRPDQSTAKIVLCRWYRGPPTDHQILTYHTLPAESLRGPAFTGRETINADCSLHIHSLSQGDSGNYTVQFLGRGINVGTTSFTVLETKGSQTEQSSWVILGPILALTLLGVLLGISFWIHHLRNKKSTAVQSAAPLYYNIPTAGQMEKNASSSNQSNPYEDLQFGDQATYEQLKE